jgi:hypothetical protein
LSRLLSMSAASVRIRLCWLCMKGVPRAMDHSYLRLQVQ